MIYGTKKWLTATLALSTTYYGGVSAADLTVTSGNTQVFDGSANFPGGVDVSGGTLVIGATALQHVRCSIRQAENFLQGAASFGQNALARKTNAVIE